MQNTRSKKIGKRKSHIAKTPDVGDIPWPLYRETKIIRSRIKPSFVTCRSLGGVKRAVDLNGTDLSTCIGQFLLLHEVFGIKISTPRRIAPTRYSNSCFHRSRIPVDTKLRKMTFNKKPNRKCYSKKITKQPSLF